MDLETAVMGLIVKAGEAKSIAYAALSKAKEGDFEEAKKLYDDAQACVYEAHNQQTQLLTAEANGEIKFVNLLTVHSQDHLMTTLLALELVKEFIDLYQKIEN